MRKTSYVSHTHYEFGSVLKFIEQVFDLPPLGPASEGYTDTRATSIVNSFDFTRRPRAFVPISSKYPCRTFLPSRRRTSPLIRSRRTPRIPAAFLCCVLSACSHDGGFPQLPNAALHSGRERAGNTGYRSIYSFGRKPNDGFASFADLIAVGDRLYGTTQ